MSIDGAIKTVATAMSNTNAMTMLSESRKRDAPVQAKNWALFGLAATKPDTWKGFI